MSTFEEAERAREELRRFAAQSVADLLAKSQRPPARAASSSKALRDYLRWSRQVRSTGHTYAALGG